MDYNIELQLVAFQKQEVGGAQVYPTQVYLSCPSFPILGCCVLGPDAVVENLGFMTLFSGRPTTECI